MKEHFTDLEFGVIYIKRNQRAKNFIARRKSDFIELTTPVYVPLAEIIKTFEQIKPRLRGLRAKPSFLLTPDTTLTTLSFRLKIEQRNIRNYHAVLKDQVLHITCPENVDFENVSLQNTLKNTIESVMRAEAKRIFPLKISKLASMYNFYYKGVSINKSKTRWGSCSSQKKINLSYFCLFLPEHLIDFVILHELCHTIEMNHGSNFWRLLDSVTAGCAKSLTNELKTITTPW